MTYTGLLSDSRKRFLNQGSLFFSKASSMLERSCRVRYLLLQNLWLSIVHTSASPPPIGTCFCFQAEVGCEEFVLTPGARHDRDSTPVFPNMASTALYHTVIPLSLEVKWTTTDYSYGQFHTYRLRSTSPFSLRAAEFQRVTRKQMA